ncbi:3'(2'),5'-bisphosphate nucleotidase CysQ [Thalassococcus lentus]|uniref:3'(2'),5'-bisphosphate nucleotidase CysQ n=1 Tax=Thalassococcus lentus TaxID=1210524 RepID=A0ABT4XV35_9RHOB|nr:3'(2'),5'-bisphosphate nucleotidase CysQ [Thalassococcus lentus]MDA7425830.1 3'(2'),5'-bisphosphate nucleotidase CysQ [Thalassococcus lentus]
MQGSDLELLIDAAQAAGCVATGFVGGALDVQYKNGDQSPVTAADFAVNALLEDKLRNARPDYGWLSEESPDGTDRLGAERVFIIDPIDGTRSFIEGSNTWAHSIAIARNGAIEAAVVFLPMRDKLYSASLGSGARLNGRSINVGNQTTLESGSMLAVKRAFEPDLWPGGVPAMQRSHRPSLAYRLSLVAEGRYDAMFTPRAAWEWDIAAGALILAEAGAQVTDRRGGPLRFNNAHPQTDGVLTANPNLHASLLDRLL